MNKQIRIRTLNEESYSRIKEEILMGHLGWGDRLDIVKLAEEFGISRSPVVKAVDKLALEGFVEVIPNKGSFVAYPTRKTIDEVTEIRVMLETTALKLAFSKNKEKLLTELTKNEEYLIKIQKNQDSYFENFLMYDRKFHMIIARNSDNSRIVELFEHVRTQIEFFRLYTFIQEQVQNAIEKHQLIIGALDSGDHNLAATYLENHLLDVQRDTIKSFNYKRDN